MVYLELLMLLLMVAMALDAVAALVLGSVELESAVVAGSALEPSEAIEGAAS